MTDTESDLPTAIGAPARRALLAAGHTRLEQLAALSEADLLRLHGVGPKAVRLIRQALAERGLAFADKPGEPGSSRP
jgi:predicted flap endonuclease-1-like 5' DNA nuclease